MIKPQKIVDLLEKQLAFVKMLLESDRDIGGFAIIVPPDGDPITFVNISSQDDAMSFYKYLADKLTASREVTNLGAIRTGR